MLKECFLFAPMFAIGPCESVLIVRSKVLAFRSQDDIFNNRAQSVGMGTQRRSTFPIINSLDNE